mgnify:CR=1 FL=1
MRVVEDDRVAERAVVLGLRTLDQAEVREGLRAGDAVLLDPSPSPGTRVRPRVVPEAEAPPAAAAAAGSERLGNAMSRGAVR